MVGKLMFRVGRRPEGPGQRRYTKYYRHHDDIAISNMRDTSNGGFPEGRGGLLVESSAGSNSNEGSRNWPAGGQKEPEGKRAGKICLARKIRKAAEATETSDVERAAVEAELRRQPPKIKNNLLFGPWYRIVRRPPPEAFLFTGEASATTTLSMVDVHMRITGHVLATYRVLEKERATLLDVVLKSQNPLIVDLSAGTGDSALALVVALKKACVERIVERVNRSVFEENKRRRDGGSSQMTQEEEGTFRSGRVAELEPEFELDRPDVRIVLNDPIYRLRGRKKSGFSGRTIEQMAKDRIGLVLKRAKIETARRDIEETTAFDGSGVEGIDIALMANTLPFLHKRRNTARLMNERVRPGGLIAVVDEPTVSRPHLVPSPYVSKEVAFLFRLITSPEPVTDTLILSDMFYTSSGGPSLTGSGESRVEGEGVYPHDMRLWLLRRRSND